ncbi:hypothetical protein [Flavihumibacter petaseus]|uniref:Uncharacterized protein n=1 Tax=Flavihumibacter petaseus NBRC 106054 TaxID=1220578 RepID=A0A0E9MUE1_9BACT|nr:hypothetical protein [Flavihumibacter petaseus]GAO41362.1 hypothetical protein FPE01S_01_03740 [Flavihumibacter petaseus NBRC 106054]
MLRLFTAIAATLLAVSSFGQTIKLTQKKGADDFIVKNGNYVIYFKKSDIIAGIAAIDKTLNTDHSAIAALLKDNKLTLLDLNSVSQSDKAFVELIKSNLGSLLLLKGKAAIFAEKKQLTRILADESPRMVELDGSSRTAILFTEAGNENRIFLGDLSSDIKRE